MEAGLRVSKRAKTSHMAKVKLKRLETKQILGVVLFP